MPEEDVLLDEMMERIIQSIQEFCNVADRDVRLELHVKPGHGEEPFGLLRMFKPKVSH